MPVDIQTMERLTERLELADQLLAGRWTMLEPQDLPGRYGQVVKAIDHLLEAIQAESILVGGWAVWRYGFEGRLTEDIDIVLSTSCIEEFMRAASASGFEILPQPSGRWPKLLHNETKIKVDILPEGARPGTASKPAPTTIPHPAQLGGNSDRLRYVTLPRLIELKLAAGRAQDQADVIQLLRTHADQIPMIRQHLASIHAEYVNAFDYFVRRAEEDDDR